MFVMMVCVCCDVDVDGCSDVDGVVLGWGLKWSALALSLTHLSWAAAFFFSVSLSSRARSFLAVTVGTVGTVGGRSPPARV